MILKTNDREIKLIFRTKKIVELADKFKEDNFDNLFFKASSLNNVKALATIIDAFAEDENKKRVFGSDLNKVYDFIDIWKKDNSKTYEDLFVELAKAINEEGFFLKTMTEEELKKEMNNSLSSIDMTEIIKTTTNNVATQIVAEEFKGFKA